MNDRQHDSYTVTVKKVVDYIQQHLDTNHSADQLSAVAGLSKFHFHRMFSAIAGITAIKLIQLLRLRRASYDLAFSRNKSITDIAFETGFENAESFSRAFKNTFAQTPSEFRKEPQWKPWLEKFELPVLGGKHTMQVDIVDFPKTKVAALEYSGEHTLLNQAIGRFVEWRKLHGLSLDNSKTFNINYIDDNWPENITIDLCIEVKNDIADNEFNIINKIIPGGRCAVLRHIGSSDNIEQSVLYLYREWLPASGEKLRDFPCFFHRVKLYPTQVAEHEQITDIYLPIT